MSLLKIITFYLSNYFKYLLLLLFFMLLGRFFYLLICSIYAKENINNEKLLLIKKEILFPVIGLLFTGNLLILLNFFLPLKNFIVYLIIGIIIIQQLVSINYKIPKFDIHKIVYFLIIPSILIVSISDITFHYDAAYYHLNHQNWLRESNLIVGMVNIFWPFGMSSIYEYLSAFLWFDSSFILLHYLNLICIHFLFSSIYYFLFISKDRDLNNVGIFFLIFSVFDNFGFGGGRNGFIYIQEVGKQDTAVACLSIFLSVIILKLIKEYKFEKINTIFILLIAFLVYEIKVSGVFIFFLVALYFLQILKVGKSSIKELLRMCIPTFLIALLWYIKSFLTTACLVFPVTVTCYKSFSWYELGSTQSIEKYTTGTSFAFMEYFLSPNLNFIDWFNNFFGVDGNSFSNFYRNVYVNFLISFIVLIIIKNIFFKHHKNSKFFNTILFLYVFVGLLYLVFYGPIPRYTIGILTTSVCSIGFYAKESRLKIPVMVFYVLFFFSVALVPRLNSYKSFIMNSNLVIEIESINEEQNINNIKYWTKPESGDRCWVNIECTTNEKEIVLKDGLLFRVANKVLN